ncbi:MAG TPA: hypothetical protein DDY20_03325 [Desulfobulbaceae bacterium]|nr:hypothetical protein [Desulfobulbaceae bacterium]
MDNRFFSQPILNSPYASPVRYWELDGEGQPTQQIIESRRPARFITPIPQPRKRKGKAIQQDLFAVHELTSQAQQYDPTSIINELRQHVDTWRKLPNSNDWQVRRKPPAFSKSRKTSERMPRKRRAPWKPTGCRASTIWVDMALGIC